jgi:isopropylmalate/homocitrate/citramalate synthase
MSHDPDEPTDLIFDWCHHGPHRFEPRVVELNDETLRDGLQSPSVVDPPVETKIRIVHMMDELGIECASMGIPAAGSRQKADVVTLCRQIVDQRLRIRPNCGGRTVVEDVAQIADVAQRSGADVEACLFIGSSPIRQYAEGWDVEHLVEQTRESVGFAVREGLRVMFITEDTTRSAPAHLERLFRAAIEAGASRVCLCDTVGSVTPPGVRNLLLWTRCVLDSIGGDVGVDWHGHRDRGLGLANTLAAVEAGATRVHGTVLGIGERVGNTATEEIMVNLRMLGVLDRDLSRLPRFVETVAHALGVSIPPSTPIVGRDAFRTAAGVHAAAVVKACQRGEHWVADRVYSAVPASWLGRRQEIEIGPLSGKSNVRHFLRAHEMSDDPDGIVAVLAAAKASDRILTEGEVLALLRREGASR